MIVIANVAVLFVAALHVLFLVIEMFLWRKPVGMKIFRLTPEVAAASFPLAASQGLYNGFLAAGLVWGLLVSEIEIQVFFLVCVVIAGVFGSITARRSILWYQALPGAVALALAAFAHAR